MTPQRRAVLIGALILAVLTLALSIALVLGPPRAWTPWGSGNPHPPWGPMMGSNVAPAGGGEPVESLDEASERARAFADRLGLVVNEVMEFSNGYYAELATTGGQGATEVLIDPDTGAVGLEIGPAMMWNTAYGVHARGTGGAARLTPERAQTIAQDWLDANRPDLTADEPHTFPGYYTLHTLREDAIDGMLSVHATTGTVWYHTWHGTFVDMTPQDHD